MRLAIQITDLQKEIIIKIEALLKKYGFLPYPQSISGDIVDKWIFIKGMRYEYVPYLSHVGELDKDSILYSFNEEDLEVLEDILKDWANQNNDFIDFLERNLDIKVVITPKHIGEEIINISLSIPGNRTLVRKVFKLQTNSLGQKRML